MPREGRALVAALATPLSQSFPTAASAGAQWPGALLPRLEQLDRIAGRVVEHDLCPARSRDDVATETYPGVAELLHLGRDVFDHVADVDGRHDWSLRVLRDHSDI